MKNYGFDPRTDFDFPLPETEKRRESRVEAYIEHLIRQGGKIQERGTALDEKLDYVEDVIARLERMLGHIQSSLMTPGSNPDLSSDFLAGMLRGVNLAIAMYRGDEMEIKNLEILRKMEDRIREEIKE